MRDEEQDSNRMTKWQRNAQTTMKKQRGQPKAWRGDGAARRAKWRPGRAKMVKKMGYSSDDLAARKTKRASIRLKRSSFVLLHRSALFLQSFGSTIQLNGGGSEISIPSTARALGVECSLSAEESIHPD
eukprot:6176334-Pleurochrysis_carterae.AAC.1